MSRLGGLSPGTKPTLKRPLLASWARACGAEPASHLRALSSRLRMNECPGTQPCPLSLTPRFSELWGAAEPRRLSPHVAHGFCLSRRSCIFRHKEAELRRGCGGGLRGRGRGGLQEPCLLLAGLHLFLVLCTLHVPVGDSTWQGVCAHV